MWASGVYFAAAPEARSIGILRSLPSSQRQGPVSRKLAGDPFYLHAGSQSGLFLRRYGPAREGAPFGPPRTNQALGGDPSVELRVERNDVLDDSWTCGIG
jgi:hypothetical protein